MQDSPRVLLLGLAATFAFGACGDASVTPPTDTDASTSSSVCGTHASPGILKVTGLSPAIGATVANRGIVHGFVVENAPAVFVNFPLNYTAAHSVGLSKPADPKIQATQSGSNVIYQFTVDGWSRAPGHVELFVSNGFDTMKNCYWVFPSPLFSYDITSAIDGGVAAGALDGGVSSVDGPSSVPGALDAAGALDAPAEIDVPLTIDGPPTAEVPGVPDGGAPVQLDAAIDVASSVD